MSFSISVSGEILSMSLSCQLLLAQVLSSSTPITIWYSKIPSGALDDTFMNGNMLDPNLLSSTNPAYQFSFLYHLSTSSSLDLDASMKYLLTVQVSG